MFGIMVVETGFEGKRLCNREHALAMSKDSARECGLYC